MVLRIGIYVSLILFCSLATSAQSRTHKTYSGPFGKGEATYTYVDAPDGTRIFDGKFTYRQGKCTLTGQFQNDLQSGSWTFTDNSENFFVKTLVKKNCTFNFDDNGLLSGPVSRKIYFKNGTVIETESYNLDEGRKEGEYKYIDWLNRKTTATGKFHEGKRTGIWRYTYADREPESVNYDIKDPSGNPQVTTIDPTTGDKNVYYSLEHSHSGEEKVYFREINDVGILYRKSDCDFEDIKASPSSFSYNGEYYHLDKLVRDHTTLTSETYNPKANVKLRLIIEKDGTISSTRILTGFNEVIDADAIQLVTHFGLKPLTRWSDRIHDYEPVRTIVRMELSYPFIEERFWKKEVPSNETDEPAVIVDAPDQQPTFPGGDAELNKWVSNHIRYPAMAADSGIQGCVIVKFVVQKDGSIGEVKVSRGKDPGLDNEAVRVVKSLPKFIPGKLNGQAVNTWFTLPVNFRLH